MANDHETPDQINKYISEHINDELKATWQKEHEEAAYIGANFVLFMTTIFAKLKEVYATPKQVMDALSLLVIGHLQRGNNLDNILNDKTSKEEFINAISGPLAILEVRSNKDQEDSIGLNTALTLGRIAGSFPLLTTRIILQMSGKVFKFVEPQMLYSLINMNWDTTIHHQCQASCVPSVLTSAMEKSVANSYLRALVIVNAVKGNVLSGHSATTFNQDNIANSIKFITLAFNSSTVSEGERKKVWVDMVNSLEAGFLAACDTSQWGKLIPDIIK